MQHELSDLLRRGNKHLRIFIVDWIGWSGAVVADIIDCTFANLDSDGSFALIVWVVFVILARIPAITIRIVRIVFCGVTYVAIPSIRVFNVVTAVAAWPINTAVAIALIVVVFLIIHLISILLFFVHGSFIVQWWW